MTVLEGVLREELGRLESNLLAFKEKLSHLPRGTIYISKVYNSSFVYRKRKEGGKVISEYIGPLSDNRSQQAIEQAKDYKRLKKMISDGNKELAKLRKAVKVYDKQWKSLKRNIKCTR